LGALLAFHWRAHEAAIDSASAVARFELRVDDVTVQSGSVSEGQLLESGQRGRIVLELASARLDMQPGTQLRLLRLCERELAFSLLAGELAIDFHPVRHGEQRLRVETRSARVLVVGTRLRVQVDTLGNTRVAVIEGAVDVVPSSGTETRRVVAGGQTWVRVDEGDRDERAVRATIEEKLAQLPPAVATPGAASEELEVETSVAPTRDTTNKLNAARQLLRQAQHRAARNLLRGVAEQPVPLRFRVEALTLMAESYTAQGQIEQAGAAYRRADEMAGRHAVGDNARFALGRLLERYAVDRPAAMLAYRHYLELAPEGALVAQARLALCRLGSVTDCE
jgi:tetratricopeptide (TPR) repeat protein